MSDSQAPWALRRGPLVLVGAAAALAVASLLLSLTWGTGSGLTTGQQAARRHYAIGVGLLVPLVALTLLFARRGSGWQAVVVAWPAALAAALVWLTLF